MSASPCWYRLHWPRAIDAEQLSDVTLLLASGGGAPVVVEAIGRRGLVEHRLALPTSRAEAVLAQLQGKLPELGVVDIEARAPVGANVAARLRLTTRSRPVRVDQAKLVSRALITVLAQAREDETVVLRWELVGSLPQSRAHSTPTPSLADVLLGRDRELDAEARRALAVKRSLPVWRVVGHVAVRAASASRTERLVVDLMAALRLSDAPDVHWLRRWTPPAAIDRAASSWFAPLRLNTAEFVAVAGWPIGSTADLPVEHRRAKLLRRPRTLPTRGRIVGVSTVPNDQQPIGLSVDAGLRHLHVLGPTGVGKSTLLLNLISADIAAGRGVVVVEPKGDLVQAVLERIPPGRTDDVVVFQPTSPKPVGFNPLGSDGRSPELVADELLVLFRRLYESSWGPRTNDILGSSLLTLARTPGMNLCALPVLLTDAGFRHRVVSQIDDPVGLAPFWAGFEAWSVGERTAAVAPSLSRIRPFLLRPQLRAVLGQTRPGFDLGHVFTQRKVLLVDLDKAAMGVEAAALLGSLLLSQLWAAALHQPPTPGRHGSAFVYIDEFQDYLRLPVDLADALAQARSLGVGFVLAHQHLSQLDAATRAAVLANARSRVCFQLGADDARVIADGALEAADFQELGGFEIYAQLVADAAVQPWCSARTLPAPSALSDPEEIRARSSERYGVDRRDVDRAILEQFGSLRIDTDDLTPRRLTDGGTA